MAVQCYQVDLLARRLASEHSQQGGKEVPMTFISHSHGHDQGQNIKTI